MSSPAAEEEETAYLTMEEGDEVEEGEEGRGEAAFGGARVSAGAAAAADEDGGVEPRTTCCVCMESWTCSGAHRVCCIPCGHVYGRSCLEKWLSAHGNTSAKCPQRGEVFERKHITNLYAPANLWDGCCCIQEEEAHNSRISKYAEKLLPLVRRHASEITRSQAQFMSQVAENTARLETLEQSVDAESQSVDIRLLLLQVEGMLAISATRYTSLKGTLEMAQRHYEDVLDFVTQSFGGLLDRT